MDEDLNEFGLCGLFDGSLEFKSAKDERVAPPTPPPPRYQLPQWFLTSNVKIQTELLSVTPRTCIQLLEFDSSVQESPSVERADSFIERSVTGIFGLRRDIFDELRDMTLDAISPRGGGRLPYDQPSILLCAQAERSYELAEAALYHLARGLSADVITLDLEDFQDLGLDFCSQESSDKKDECKKLRIDDLNSFAYHYFATEKRDSASAPETKRNFDAISALLDAPQQKRNSTCEGKEEPLFVHVRDGNRLTSTEAGRRLVHRLRETVEFRRRDGQKVVLFLTILTNKEPLKIDAKDLFSSVGTVDTRKGRYSTITGIADALRVDGASTLNLGNPNPDDKYARRRDVYYDRNVRQLKRCIRERLDGKLSESITCPGAVWDIRETSPVCSSNVLECGMLSTDDFRRASRQIVHRAISSSELTLQDVVAVLKRMYRSTFPSKPPVPEPTQPVETPVQTVQSRLAQIRQSCNEFEKTLLSNFIDASALTTTYADVIIDPETKATVQQLMHLSKQRVTASSTDLLKHIQINGALFHGPPGTGKTLLVRAIAKESGSNMLCVDSAALTSKWVGETEKYIHAAFTLAKKMAPCIIFIDEVDALFYRRTSHDHTWERKALTQFLQEMDGLGTEEAKPFVVVATNRASDLDEAFLRRLPHKVLFTLPGEEERAQILRGFVKEEDLDPLVDIGALAKATKGYSGSDLKSLCGQAALAWATENTGVVPKEGEVRKLCLGVEHFAKALQRTGNPQSKLPNAVGK